MSAVSMWRHERQGRLIHSGLIAVNAVEIHPVNNSRSRRGHAWHAHGAVCGMGYGAGLRPALFPAILSATCGGDLSLVVSLFFFLRPACIYWYSSVYNHMVPHEPKQKITRPKPEHDKSDKAL